MKAKVTIIFQTQSHKWDGEPQAGEYLVALRKTEFRGGVDYIFEAFITTVNDDGLVDPMGIYKKNVIRAGSDYEAIRYAFALLENIYMHAEAVKKDANEKARQTSTPEQESKVFCLWHMRNDEDGKVWHGTCGVIFGDADILIARGLNYCPNCGRVVKEGI